MSRRQQISPFSLKIPFSPEPSLPLGHALNVSLFCWKSRRFGSEKGTGQSCPRPFPPSDPLCPQRSEGVTPRGTSHGLRRQEVLWLPGLPGAVGSRGGRLPGLGRSGGEGGCRWGLGSQGFTVASVGGVSSCHLCPSARRQLGPRPLRPPGLCASSLFSS